VRVEVDVAPGLPGFTIVGLADTALQEARERVRGAIRNSALNLAGATSSGTANGTWHTSGPGDRRRDEPFGDCHDPLIVSRLQVAPRNS
jgi:hypothetical protein